MSSFQKESRKIPFTIATKVDLNIDMTKEIRNLQVKSKITEEKPEEDTRQGNDRPCLYLSRLNIVKMSPLPKSDLQILYNTHQNPNNPFRSVKHFWVGVLENTKLSYVKRTIMLMRPYFKYY